MLTLVNGVETENLSVADRGLQYGDGLFETIAVRNGQPRLWARHMQRLQHGCERLAISMPDAGLLADESQRALQHAQSAVIKIMLTRGSGTRGYRPDPAQEPTRIVRALPSPQHPETNRTQGIAVRWCQTRLGRQPLLAGLKHLNRLEQVLARAEWQQEFAEGLMCDSDGRVIEGTMSNLFIVRDGVLVTPDLSQCGVAGVMRAEVLDQAARLGIVTRIEPLTAEAVTVADEIFVTNAVIGLWPVSLLETRHYVVGKVTQALQAALSDSD